MPPTKKAAPRVAPVDEGDEDEAPISTGPKLRSAPPAPVEDTDEADEDEAPPTMQIRRGFSAARQVAESTSSFAQSFKLTEQVQIIKFLEDDPYASYTRHWIERAAAAGGRNLRAFTCLKNFGKTCPLCEAGDKPSAVSSFNVALIGDDGVPLLKSFDCGPKLLNLVENNARDPKIAPLTKGYFLASKSGKKGTVNYQLIPIKPHSLSDDYDIDAPTAAELDKLGLYDTSIIEVPKTKDLQAVAAEIADEY